MMLLNLISPEAQKNLRTYVYLGVARTGSLVVVGLGILFLAGLGFGSYQLHGRTARLTTDADRSTLLIRGQMQATIGDTTKRINAQIQVLKNIQKRSIAWLPVLHAFNKLIPSGIHLSSITLTQNPTQIVFTGTADTRDAYVAFENELQSSKLTPDVSFPLQTKKTNLEFSITAPLKLAP